MSRVSISMSRDDISTDSLAASSASVENDIMTAEHPLGEYVTLRQPNISVPSSPPQWIVTRENSVIVFTGEVTIESAAALTQAIEESVRECLRTRGTVAAPVDTLNSHDNSHGSDDTPTATPHPPPAATHTDPYATIEIVINSNGGQSIAVGTVRDYFNGLRHLPNRPKIVTTGISVQSAGASLWLLGDERALWPGTTIMIHGQYSIVNGAIDHSPETRAINDMTNRRTAKYLAKLSGHTRADWMSLINTGLDIIISASCAYKLKLATSVITRN